MTKARLIANGEFLTSSSPLDPTKLDSNFGEIPADLLDDLTGGLAVHDFYTAPDNLTQLQSVTSFNLSTILTEQDSDGLVGAGMELQPQPVPDSYVFKENGKYLIQAQIGLQTPSADQFYAGGNIVVSTDGGASSFVIARGYNHIYGGMSGSSEWTTVVMTGVLDVTDKDQTWVKLNMASDQNVNIMLQEAVTHIRFMRLDS